MSRQSLRKVKLTSKFEEFSTSRLSKVISPKVEPGLKRAAAQQLTSTPVAQVAPVSSAPQTPSAPSTPVPPPPKQSKYKLQQQLQQQQQQQQQLQTPQQQPHQHDQHQSTPVVTPVPSEGGKPTNYLPLKLTANGKIRGRPRKCFQQKAETVVKPISSTREELLRLREENSNLKQQLEQITVEYEDLKRQSSYTGQTVPKIDYDDLKEKYQRDIANAKRNEWCYVCSNKSKYYCCWNTTYCSKNCQVSDWYQRHMKYCERRKKALKTVS